MGEKRTGEIFLSLTLMLFTEERKGLSGPFVSLQVMPSDLPTF
jgi:hypothetical protein